jgi:hypothetical protein
MGVAQPVRGNRSLYPGPDGSGLDDAMHLGLVQVSLALAGGEHRRIKSGFAFESS